MHDAIDSISLSQKYTVGAYPLTAFESGPQKRKETSHVPSEEQSPWSASLAAEPEPEPFSVFALEQCCLLLAHPFFGTTDYNFTLLPTL